MRTLLLSTILLASLVSLQQCGWEGEPTAEQRLGAQYCGSCHMTPTPDLLTKEIWASKVMPLMGAYLGVYDLKDRNFYLKDELERPYLEKVFPANPTLPDSAWRALKNYFIEGAPDVLPRPEGAPLVYQQDQFSVGEIRDDPLATSPSLSTCVSARGGEITVAGLLAGDRGLVRKFTETGRVISRDTLPGAISKLPLRASDPYLLMGSLVPSDVPSGRLVLPGEFSQQNDLQRPLDFAYLDLNLDGTVDTIIAEYGNRLGALAMYAAGKRTLLSPTPGAIRLRVADLDQDGHEDLIALFAQGDERIEAYFARTESYERKLLARFPPSFGSSDLELADMDGDGDLDLVHTAGDNYDYKPIPKPYHGVRIYENIEGDFAETYFYHLDGAYGVEAADFNQDGRVDLAAIAYFVPPSQRSIKGFVLLHQTAPGTFRASGFERPIGQHFIVMDQGDVDGDGDVDLVIGNFAAYLPDGFPDLRKPGGRDPVAILLRNNLK